MSSYTILRKIKSLMLDKSLDNNSIVVDFSVFFKTLFSVWKYFIEFEFYTVSLEKHLLKLAQLLTLAPMTVK